MSKSGAEQAPEPMGQRGPVKRPVRAGQVIFNVMKPRPLRIGLAGILVVSALVAVALNVGPTRAERHVAEASLYGPTIASVQQAV